MPNFVYDRTDLPDGKIDARPLTGPPEESITAAEWNLAMQGMYDMRDAMVGTTGAQATDIVVKVGTTAADAAINAAAKLFSVRTSIGGTEAEKLFVTKSGLTIDGQNLTNSPAITLTNVGAGTAGIIQYPASFGYSLWGNWSGLSSWGFANQNRGIHLVTSGNAYDAGDQCILLSGSPNPGTPPVVRVTGNDAPRSFMEFGATGSAVLVVGKDGSLTRPNGTVSTDVSIKVGTTVADGSVVAGAKLLSVRSGIGGTETEYLSVGKPASLYGPVVQIPHAATATNQPAITLDGYGSGYSGGIALWGGWNGGGYIGNNSNVQLDVWATNRGIKIWNNGDAYIAATTPAVQISATARGVEGRPQVAIYGGGVGATDVPVKVGTNVADGSVNAAAKLFSIRTGIGGTETEYLYVNKSSLVVPTANTSFDVSQESTSQILVKNTGGQQAVVGASFGGVVKGAWRTDYVGNLNWHAGGGYHQFYMDTSLSYPALWMGLSGGVPRVNIGTTSTNTARLVVAGAGSEDIQRWHGGTGHVMSMTTTGALASPAGAVGTDIIIKLGTTVADGTVHAGAKLLSVQTGIGGTVVEKAYFRKSGNLIVSGAGGLVGFGDAADAYNVAAGFYNNAGNIGIWSANQGVGLYLNLGSGQTYSSYQFNALSGVRFGPVANFKANSADGDQWLLDRAGSPKLYFNAGVVGRMSELRLELVGATGANSGDQPIITGTSVADGTVHAGAKLLSVQTGIGGTPIERFYVTKGGIALVNSNTWRLEERAGGASTQLAFQAGSASWIALDASSGATWVHTWLRVLNAAGTVEYGRIDSTGIAVGSGQTLTVGVPGIAGYYSAHELKYSAGWALGAASIGHRFSGGWADNSTSYALGVMNATGTALRAAFTGIGEFRQYGTDSSGTPGAATIDKPRGISAIANGATSVVITNSLAATTSHIMVTFHDDPGGRYWVTRGAGTFTVNLSAAASGNKSFSWEVGALL